MTTEALDYIIGEVLDQDDDSDIHKALKKHKCKNLLDMVSLSDGEINALDFLDDTGDVIELKIFDLARVCQFRDFYHSCKKPGRVFNHIGDWKTITHEEFDES